MRKSPVAVALLAATIASGVIAVVSPPPMRQVIGPAGLGMIPVVLGLSTASLGARSRGRRAAASALAFVARLALWLLLARLIADPAPTFVDAATGWIASALSPIAVGFRAALGAIAGLLVLGAVVGAMMGGQTSPAPSASKATVRTGGSLGPVTAGLLRFASAVALRLVVLALCVLLAAASWTAAGMPGLLVALGRQGAITPPQQVIAAGAALLGRSGTGITALVRRRSAGWDRHESLGAWLSPVAIERDAAGDLVKSLAWQRDTKEDAEERELRELTSALVAAFDVALLSGVGSRKGSNDGQDPRQQAPRPYPYRIEAIRAWSRPGSTRSSSGRHPRLRMPSWPRSPPSISSRPSTPRPAGRQPSCAACAFPIAASPTIRFAAGNPAFSWRSIDRSSRRRRPLSLWIQGKQPSIARYTRPASRTATGSPAPKSASMPTPTNTGRSSQPRPSGANSRRRGRP